MSARSSLVFALRFTGPMCGAILAASAVGSSAAERTNPPPRPGPTLEAADQRGGDIELRHAGELVYTPDGWAHARGNVHIQGPNVALRADSVRFNIEAKQAIAEGRVELIRTDGEVWKGDRLEYDFGKGVAVLDQASGRSDPFRLLHAEKIERASDSRIVLHDCRITTCIHDLPHTHYHVRARKVVLTPGEELKVYGARWYFGVVPVMYLPYWRRNLADRYGWDIEPGYSSRMGYYALTSYSYPLNEIFDGASRLDYRTRRGFAVGQDILWRDARRESKGDLRLYYADDQDPDLQSPSGEPTGVSNERYRIRLRHRHILGARDTLRVQAHWLSDSEFLEDFFEREYRRSRQPENFAVYTRTGDTYVLDLLFRRRLNDFYADIHREPELSLRFLRREIGSSGFFYEGRTTAARLERVWPDTNTNDVSYALERVDSSHMFYRPQKLFGFLQWVPRAGYRLTSYSQTRDWIADESGEQVEIQSGGGTRSYAQIGSEVSFKAFKTWHGGFVSPLRHVAEPYADYTWAFKPTIEPARLYPFDEVDTLDRNHSVRAGFRNKWQTRIGDTAYDFVDLDVYTRLRIEAERGRDALDPFAFDLRVRPFVDGLSVSADGAWNLYDSAFEYYNVALKSKLGQAARTALEYRVRREQSALLTGRIDLTTSPEWAWGLGGRYEFETAILEEIEASSTRTWDCMVLRASLGYVPAYTRSDGRQREDDWRIALEFWITAFPETRLISR